MSSIFTPTPAGASCRVRVTPRAGRTVVAGVRDGHLIVKIAAAPVNGATNEALVTALATTFRLPKRSILIAAGERSRIKSVIFEGVTSATLDARLAAILSE